VRLRSACDSCHQLKVKCSGSQPCDGCVNSRSLCIYSVSGRLGRPKGTKNKRSTTQQQTLSTQPSSAQGCSFNFSSQPQTTREGNDMSGKQAWVEAPEEKKPQVLDNQQQQQQQQQQQLPTPVSLIGNDGASFIQEMWEMPLDSNSHLPNLDMKWTDSGDFPSFDQVGARFGFSTTCTITTPESRNDTADNVPFQPSRLPLVYSSINVGEDANQSATIGFLRLHDDSIG
jgi:hypothetical protein